MTLHWAYAVDIHKGPRGASNGATSDNFGLPNIQSTPPHAEHSVCKGDSYSRHVVAEIAVDRIHGNVGDAHGTFRELLVQHAVLGVLVRCELDRISLRHDAWRVYRWNAMRGPRYNRTGGNVQ
jgi:hypothetical protein